MTKKYPGQLTLHSPEEALIALKFAASVDDEDKCCVWARGYDFDNTNYTAIYLEDYADMTEKETLNCLKDYPSLQLWIEA